MRVYSKLVRVDPRPTADHDRQKLDFNERERERKRVKSLQKALTVRMGCRHASSSVDRQRFREKYCVISQCTAGKHVRFKNRVRIGDSRNAEWVSTNPRVGG